MLEIDEYRRKLVAAFPPAPFEGLISTHEECYEGIHLRRELAGKRWNELSPEVVFHGATGLALLEGDALVAFLPAWLLTAATTSDLEDPIVLEFTLYFLSDENTAAKVGSFSFDQRNAVAAFLSFVAKRFEGQYWGGHAERGLSWWQPN